MKIVELGIEVKEFDKNKDVYDIEIYDTESFKKRFVEFYKKIGSNFDDLVKQLRENGNPDPENYIVDSYLKNPKKTIDKVNLNNLLKVIRKEKIKRLNIL